MRSGFRPGLMLMLWFFSPALLATTEAERLLKQDIDRQEQERRDRRWEELRGKETPEVVAPVSPVVAAPDTGPCFPVKTIDLVPSSVLPRLRTERLLGEFRGKCLSAADLSALQQSLNAVAMEEGLVTTRVVVPEQNLGSGILHLEVWPGRLEASRSDVLTPRQMALVFPLRPGDLLNLRAMEQAVDNLNRLASFQSSIELQPGEKPGGSVADFRVVRQAPWQAGLSWNGQTMESDPVNSLRGNVTLDDPLYLADRLVLGMSANIQDSSLTRSGAQNVDYDIPWGWSRFSVGFDRSYYSNQVYTGLTTFTASGLTRAYRAEASHLLLRDAQNRLSLALHGQRRLGDNYIDEVSILVSTSRLTSSGLRFDYSRVAAPWVVDASFDAEYGTERTLAVPSPVDFHYSRIKSGSRIQYYFQGSSLQWSVDAQWSDGRILPSEQFSLVNYVTGFAPLSVSSPIAVGSRLEWSRQLPLSRFGFTSLRPALGVDYAYAPARAENPVELRLMSAKTSATVSWKQLVSRVELAVPVVQESNVEALHDWQLNGSVSLQW